MSTNLFSLHGSDGRENFEAGCAHRFARRRHRFFSLWTSSQVKVDVAIVPSGFCTRSNKEVSNLEWRNCALRFFGEWGQFRFTPILPCPTKLSNARTGKFYRPRPSEGAVTNLFACKTHLHGKYDSCNVAHCENFIFLLTQMMGDTPVAQQCGRDRFSWLQKINFKITLEKLENSQDISGAVWRHIKMCITILTQNQQPIIFFFWRNSSLMYWFPFQCFGDTFCHIKKYSYCWNYDSFKYKKYQ